MRVTGSHVERVAKDLECFVDTSHNEATMAPQTTWDACACYGCFGDEGLQGNFTHVICMGLDTKEQKNASISRMFVAAGLGAAFVGADRKEHEQHRESTASRLQLREGAVKTV